MSLNSNFLKKKQKFYNSILSSHLDKKEEKRLEIWNILSLDKFLSQYET